MKNINRIILLVAMLLTFVFFSLGYYTSYKAGLAPRAFLGKVSENIRKLDISPGLSEYINLNESKKEGLEAINKIIIRSTFTSVNINRGANQEVLVNIKGSVKSEIGENPINFSKENDLLLVDLVNKKAENPTTSGLSASITIPLNFKGSVEVYTESGNINFNSTEKNEVYIKTISGDISYEGGRENDVTVKSETGNLYIYTIGIKGNVLTNSGTVDIRTSYLEGDYRTKTGYIHISGNEMTSLVNLYTHSGEVEFSVTSGYSYEVKSETGEIRFKDELRFSPLKGIYNNGFNDLKISSSSGNIYLE